MCRCMSVAYAVPDSKRCRIEEDYEVKDQLGDGQYSVVKLGVNKKTKEEVAIKMIYRSQTEPYEFLNEVELMREVSEHPGFIKLLDVYEDENTYILVMELVKGGELFDKIGELSTYNEERVAKLIYQIVSALAFLHTKKIVHRDLKPENLLFEDESATVIKLCDFGVAERIPERGYLTEVIGTESYMAPEVEHGKPYGVSSDMYGLGVLMYIMLCGYPPFEPENGIIELEFPQEEWATISPTSKDLITLLLDHDPDKRPCASEVLKNSWICGQDTQKDELKETQSTMKIYNHYRASGVFTSMRAAKANKIEAVWSIFSNGYFSKSKNPKPPKKKLEPIIEKKQKAPNPQKKPKKKESPTHSSILSPRLGLAASDKKKLNDTPSFRSPILSQPAIPKPATEIESSKPTGPTDELQLANNNYISRDPDELQQTISLLEIKLLSLGNINSSLQDQIDEISGSYHKLKVEKDELKRDLEETLQELEIIRQKKEKKKKEKK